MIEFGNCIINFSTPTLIVAEIGVNHNGDVSLGLEMIRAAAEAGADAVKFQTFNTSHFLNANYPDFPERKKHELKYCEFEKLFSYAVECNVKFFSTPFDFTSVEMLCELGVEAIKIASSDLTNLPLLRKVGATGKPVILSTGYSQLSEIYQAYETLQLSGCTELAILHCVASYPVNYKDINLANIPFLMNLFPGIVVGFSDHSLDYELIPPVAVAMGACIIEKHFTIDQNLPGYDHKMSLNPKMFASMVKKIRIIESALGHTRMQTGVIPSEEVRINNARRSLYWGKRMQKGEIIKPSHIIAKRPGRGLPPYYLERLIGLTMQQDVEEDSLVELSHVG